MRLFICHVSEDKSDFVAPLARKLREHFDVWYDDFQLTLGDNLLQKITEGLTTSDFGVVVLSKAFFRKKKWAENELGGLFALETKTRKIILPVSKDVTEADVRSYSPILANKLAVSASEGLQKVVDEIALAVTVSQRKDELNASSAGSKVKALAQTLAQRKEAEKLAYSEKGARLVGESVEALFAEIERILTEGASASEALRFAFSKPMHHIFYASTGYGMYLGLGVRDFYLNSVVGTTLEAKVFRRRFGAFDQPHSDEQFFDELVFKPTFRAGQVVWGEDERLCNTNELAAHLVEIFINYVAKQAEGS